ncbi:tyrosine-type recombinase/integrase [Acidithiobacillus sp.]|uniref:tyrosine-type recombinase/integrase n=1 Tax=Acidithiobacillus sp. TaxID=1872118 RepID=UPI00262F1B5A|nr:tyrosine-type recombinase/integrase [Acidithiobacillus sp.]
MVRSGSEKAHRAPAQDEERQRPRCAAVQSCHSNAGSPAAQSGRAGVFGTTYNGIHESYVRACRRAGITGLTFHDLRHEATSRLFEKGFNPMEVSTITGHKTLQMLKRYTHLRAEDLAKRMG